MVEESRDFAAYFYILDEVLFKRHGVHPVHTAEEMELLAGRFPQNIKLYAAKKDNELLAGALLFLKGSVAHTQYLACSDQGRTVGALDGVINFLIEKYEVLGYKYFDFGISNEQQGRVLNEGLIRQKEEFGGRGVVHDFYELNL